MKDHDNVVYLISPLTFRKDDEVLMLHLTNLAETTTAPELYKMCLAIHEDPGHAWKYDYLTLATFIRNFGVNKVLSAIKTINKKEEDYYGKFF